jgi:hypothetical protein
MEYEALACAIALQVLSDIKVNQRELEKLIAKREMETRKKRKGRYTRKINKRKERIADATKFFTSGYCEFLTGIPGRVFLSNIDEISIPDDYIDVLMHEDEQDEGGEEYDEYFI